ncbi:hypothetical protein [Halobaculum lipolyticum]|uniref:Uncharacterized protein n=1 Tax=Halobaculum lipolyticum TaxID=3032001 RepID=A0ABD5WBP4_9EURY|nr:hypothetical protein [Halobaculum sp. DT31]
MSVGQELLDVPLPDMVHKLAKGVADAQHALDKNSVATAQALADEEVDIVTNLTRHVTDSGVTFDDPEVVTMSLLQVGLAPTFYQFSEATIEVEMDIKTQLQTETNVSVETEFEADWGVVSWNVSAEVEHNRKFGKEVHGTSRLVTTMVPVPPPEFLMPQIETFDDRTDTDPSS